MRTSLIEAVTGISVHEFVAVVNGHRRCHLAPVGASLGSSLGTKAFHAIGDHLNDWMAARQMEIDQTTGLEIDDKFAEIVENEIWSAAAEASGEHASWNAELEFVVRKLVVAQQANELVGVIPATKRMVGLDLAMTLMHFKECLWAQD